MDAKIDLVDVLAKHKAWMDGQSSGVKANLSGAYLWYADLGGANLRDAYLWGANLWGANLGGANLNWQSHTLLAEILFRAARDSIQRRMISGLIAVSTDWCWNQFVAIQHSEREWAISELAKWVKPDDGAPEVIRAAARAAGGNDATS